MLDKIDRLQPATPEEAVAALNALTGEDPEADHAKAELILLSVVPAEVLEAHRRLIARSRWWVF